MMFEDFIMLGKTIPEPQKKTGRVFVCSAGYSDEFRHLIRIYPQESATLVKIARALAAQPAR